MAYTPRKYNFDRRKFINSINSFLQFDASIASASGNPFYCEYTDIEDDVVHIGISSDSRVNTNYQPGQCKYPIADARTYFYSRLQQAHINTELIEQDYYDSVFHIMGVDGVTGLTNYGLMSFYCYNPVDGGIKTEQLTSEQAAQLMSLANNDEYYCAMRCTAWYGDTLPRTGGTGSTLFPVLRLNYSRQWTGAEWEEYLGNGIINPYGFICGYNTRGAWDTVTSYNYDVLSTNFFLYDGEKEPRTFEEALEKGKMHIWYDEYQYGMLFIKKSELIDILNSIGVPFSFSEDDCQNKPVDEFPDYKPIPDGQPENEYNVGGDGTGNNHNDKITLNNPSTKPYSVFNSMYAISGNSLTNLRNYLWRTDFLEDLRKLTSDPIENIVSCAMYPFNIPNHDSANCSSANVVIGNIDTSITASKILSGYNCLLDMGSLAIEEYWGDYADYSPYTRIELYLPYYGLISLDTNEVMGRTIHLYYVVDFTTGTTSSLLMCDDRLIDERTFNIAIQVPVTGNDNASYMRKAVISAVSGASTIALGTATANPLGILGGATTIASGVMDRRTIEKTGNTSPLNGLYMPQTAFITIKRPYKVVSANYTHDNGYPIDYYGMLSECSGYTRLANVEIDIDMSTEEREELKTILERGFYIE